MRHTHRSGDHIEAVPKSINEIHIGMSGGAEHDFSARSASARGMRCEILWAHVRFRFHDAPHAPYTGVVTHEMHADQLSRDSEGVAGIEFVAELIQWVT